MKKILLKDIAQAAGVSVALVSYVLNDKGKSNRVNADTAERIHRIANQLGYRPNTIARSLRSGRSYTIGVVLSDISNPFFAHLARCMEDAAQQAGYTVLFGSSDESVKKMDALMENLWSRGVDGLIVVPCEGALPYLETWYKRDVPFVLLDRSVPELKVPMVSLDNLEAAYCATHHLLKAGYVRPAMVAYRADLSNMTDRIAGYKRAMREAGLAKGSEVVRWPMEMPDTRVDRDLSRLMKEGVDALVFSTNTLAFKGLFYLTRSGIQIPDRMGIVCFDESEAFELFLVPLTFVRQPVKEMASCSVRALLHLLQAEEHPPLIRLLPSELIVQASSCKNPRTQA